ncbi:ATP-binding cassette domain-containing protein [Mycobacterium sp. E740]|uniref:ATP-binding cassette domain-containing protein n=1 Tax=Mycobacterium sp. E740 TaxID=1834149 RepID=UPI001E422AE8|nr:ATP-binding cassette domain-containing protein [Mycobacterium sp. E740]
MSESESDSESEPQEPRDELAVVARGISQRGPWGPVYGPLDFDIAASGVTVMVCPRGSGRTALLMTLAGRMKTRTGSLTVFGRRNAREIFGVAALSGIDELDEVAESVTVADVVTEHLRWNSPWYRRVPRARNAELARVCAPVFGPLALPTLDDYVEELSELDRRLLRIALANAERPPLLVVADLDRVTSDRHRALLLDRLVALGRDQTVVTASVNGVPADSGVRAQLVVDTVAVAEPVAEEQKGGR